MDGLEQTYGERVTFVHVNIHNPKNQDLLDEFGFTVTPDIRLVDGNGKVLATWDETMHAEDVRLAIDAALVTVDAAE